MNFSSFVFNGWGLSELAMRAVVDICDNYEIKNVLEFGSGQSTLLFKALNKTLTSFDDSEKYATEDAVVRDLYQCNDIQFDAFLRGDLFWEDSCDTLTLIKTRHTRQHNCFYKIYSDDINPRTDFVLVDGPNGNGRSIAFQILKRHIKNEFFLFIDDYDHYPFLTDLDMAFSKYSIINLHHRPSDRWVILKIFPES